MTSSPTLLFLARFPRSDKLPLPSSGNAVNMYSLFNVVSGTNDVGYPEAKAPFVLTMIPGSAQSSCWGTPGVSRWRRRSGSRSRSC